MKKILCFDLDDTICDTSTVILEQAGRFNKEEFNIHEPLHAHDNCSDFLEFLNAFGWGEEQIESFFDKNYPAFLEEVVPKVGVVDTIHKLHLSGWKIHIVTSRREINGRVYLMTEKWLQKHGVIFDSLTIEAINKIPILKDKETDFFFDDSIKNCIHASQSGITSFLMDTPYNRAFSCREIERIKSFSDIPDVLLAYDK